MIMNYRKRVDLMYNLVYVIGRLTKEVELVKDENGKSYSVVNLAIQRSYKNVDGIYETDFVDVRLHRGIAESTSEYCKKGDLVGIRGRVENHFEEKDGEKISKTIIVGDRISFLAAQKTHDKKNEIEMD